MPFSTLWAVMFFLMLITIGIDTEFGMLEGVVTPIIDMKLLPSLNKEVLSGKSAYESLWHLQYVCTGQLAFPVETQLLVFSFIVWVVNMVW